MILTQNETIGLIIGLLCSVPISIVLLYANVKLLNENKLLRFRIRVLRKAKQVRGV